MKPSEQFARNAGKRRRMMDELRTALRDVQGLVCAIPECREPWTDVAHIDASGMGGRPSTYRLDNVCGLCRWHHDLVDGRTLTGRQELLRSLLRRVVLAGRTDADAPA